MQSILGLIQAFFTHLIYPAIYFLLSLAWHLLYYAFCLGIKVLELGSIVMVQAGYWMFYAGYALTTGALRLLASPVFYLCYELPLSLLTNTWQFLSSLSQPLGQALISLAGAFAQTVTSLSRQLFLMAVNGVSAFQTAFAANSTLRLFVYAIPVTATGSVLIYKNFKKLFSQDPAPIVLRPHPAPAEVAPKSAVLAPVVEPAKKPPTLQEYLRSFTKKKTFIQKFEKRKIELPSEHEFLCPLSLEIMNIPIYIEMKDKNNKIYQYYFDYQPLLNYAAKVDGGRKNPLVPTHIFRESDIKPAIELKDKIIAYLKEYDANVAALDEDKKEYVPVYLNQARVRREGESVNRNSDNNNKARHKRK